MKNVFLLIGFLAPVFLFSQDELKIAVPNNSMYIDEYNYCTLGFVDDLKMGKDPSKKGLDFNPVHTFRHEEGFSSALVEVYQVLGTDCKCVKAYMIVIDKKRSHCLPFSLADNVIQNKFKYWDYSKSSPWDRKLIMMSMYEVLKSIHTEYTTK